MGTNFYIEGTGEHIGKRSAAGLYCWDCNVTLCVTGEAGVHTGESSWFYHCPKCGKAKVEEDMENSASGRELGFNNNRPKRKTGVRSCSSFTWALMPCHINLDAGVTDEYDRYLTKKEFESVLEECPVQFFNLIGEEFC